MSFQKRQIKEKNFQLVFFKTFFTKYTSKTTMVLSDTFPEDKLPPCWSDDVRMNALFAPFRLKSANPESWEMKMKFWSDMVRQWCRHKMDPIVSASDIKCAFQRRGRTAACIDIVIEEMFRFVFLYFLFF